jgi:hypothetical protein
MLFVKDYLPHLQLHDNDCEVKLLGLGDTTASQWIALDLYFRSYVDNSFIIIQVKFLVVPGMGHYKKVILGNDVSVLSYEYEYE